MSPAALGYALFLAGAPLGLVNFVTIGFGASFLKAAIGIGLSFAANALFGPKPIQSSIKPLESQQQIRTTLASRRRSFGTVRLSGIVAFFVSDESVDVLYLLIALNHGRISSFEQYFIDGNEVEIDGSGIVTTTAYVNGANQVKLLTRLGADPETEYSEIADTFDVSDVRGDGVASILGMFGDLDDPNDQQKLYPNGYPQIRVTINSSVCFDPRDSTQDVDDETTWLFSENPVVVLITYLIDPDGYGLSYADDILPNIDEWIEAAIICDEEVALSAGGTESRYRIAGTFQLTDRPGDIVQRILSTCDGRCWPKGDGTIGISVGRFETPLVTIATRDVLALQATRGQDTLDKIIGVRAQYMSPDHDYTEQEAEAWPDAATVQAGDEERSTALDLTWVPSHSQARRLMKRAYLRLTSGWSIRVTTNLAGLRAIDERFINVSIDTPAINEVFEVQKITIDPIEPEVTIEAIAVGASIDDWDAASEEGTPPAQPEGWVFIPLAQGTRITDCGTRPEAGFDGSTDQDDSLTSNSNSTTAYMGKSFPSPKKFAKAVVYGSNNRGYCHDAGGGDTITLTAYGKTGTAPANGTDGTAISDPLVFVESADESAGREIVSTDTDSEWDHIWIEGSTSNAGDNNFGYAEVQLYERR